MLIIRKNHGSPPLVGLVVSVICIGLALPAWAKTPVVADDAMTKFEKQLLNITDGSNRTSKDKDAELIMYEQKAEESLKKEKYSEVVESCSKAIEINPEDLHAYRLRALAYLRLGQQENAKNDQAKLIGLQQQVSERNSKKEIAKCTAVIEANPKDAKAYAERAAAFMSLNQYDEAIADSSKAIKLDPSDKYAYFTRMAAYMAMHDHVKALADRQKFQTLDRGDKLRLSTSAVIDYSRMLEGNPNDANALLNRARAYIDLGNFSSAKTDCDTLLKLNVDSAEVRQMRTRCQKEMRKHVIKKGKNSCVDGASN